jgi:hypothetical protein
MFIHRVMPKAPLWFHEGFAAYARTVDYREGGGQRMACFGTPTGSPSSYVELKELVEMPWEKYNTGVKGWYKHTARSLIDFVIHADGGKDLTKIETLIDAVGAGKAGGEPLLAVYSGQTLDALNPKVVGHGNDVAAMAESKTQARGMCPLAFGVPPELAPDTSERKLEPVPAEDIKALNAGLMKLPGREGGYAPWFPAEVVAGAN